MNTTLEVPKSQVLANVAKWRQEHNLDPKPRRKFQNPPRFVHKADRQHVGGGK